MIFSSFKRNKNYKKLKENITRLNLCFNKKQFTLLLTFKYFNSINYISIPPKNIKEKTPFMLNLVLTSTVFCQKLEYFVKWPLATTNVAASGGIFSQEQSKPENFKSIFFTLNIEYVSNYTIKITIKTYC